MTGKYKNVYNLRNDLVVCLKHIEKRKSVKSVFVTDQFYEVPLSGVKYKFWVLIKCRAWCRIAQFVTQKTV